MKRAGLLAWAGLLTVWCLPATLAPALEPTGIVYESEAISSPESAWLLNQRTGGQWMLWTTEDDIESKRSGKAVLAGPPVAADRASPEEGAPPLHSVVTDLKPGAYRVYVSNPGGRPLAYSTDGAEWFRHDGGELFLGAHEIEDGRFEFWVDDRFAHPPGNPGPGYYDYVRFVPISPLELNVRRYAVWRSLRDWLAQGDRGFTVPAQETTGWVGFEREGECIRGGDQAGHRFAYTVDRAGTWYLGVRMNDDVDGAERLVADLNGEPFACFAADEAPGGIRLFSYERPLELAAGDTLTFTCETPVGFYRVYDLFFAREPLAPPAPSFQFIEAWSPEPGAVDLCWTTTAVTETGRVQYGAGDWTHATERSAYRGRNHRVQLRGLDPGQEYQARIVTEHDREPVVSEPVRFRPAPPAAPPTQTQTIALAVPEPTSYPREGWPATVGVPFARGMLATVDDLRLFDPDGEPIVLQAECFSRWPDGSVKWVVCSFLAKTSVSGGPAAYELRAESARAAPRSGQGAVTDHDRPAAWPGRLVLEDGDGARHSAVAPDLGSFDVEVAGPVRTVLKWSGPLVGEDGEAGWGGLIRLTLCQGLPIVGVNVSVWNDRVEPKFRPIRSLALEVPITSGDPRGGINGRPPAPIPDDQGLWVFQDRDNRFRERTPEGVVAGERAAGVAVAEAGTGRLTVVLRDFWQTYPSRIAVKPDGIRVGLLPRLEPDTYDDEESQAWFYKLYTWSEDGQYLFRAGQLTQHQLYVCHEGADNAYDADALAAWLAHPLLPQADPAYLCATGALGRPLFARTQGVWDDYEALFERSFAASLEDRAQRRSYGWMHYGDWFGERYLNYGNSEYDLAWGLAVQWMRTGHRPYFDRGLEMARHFSTVDTIHGSPAHRSRCLVWEHCYNHVGTGLTLEECRFPEDAEDARIYLERFGGMIDGAMDPQGHIYQEGNWVYAALTGDAWLRRVAERVCTHQAEKLTPAFNFSIERSGGWPIINAAAAYSFTGNPYYLNAARLMAERCIERQDPETGGWLHTPPRNETDGQAVLGGKAFAVGILSHGLLRYLAQEPQDRPDVRAMLVRGADWLMNESWNPGKGFRYISNAPNYRDTGGRGITSYLNADIISFAYEETGDPKYLAFWKEMMAGVFEGQAYGMGKAFAQATRQTLFGLDRVRQWGVTSAPPLP